MKEWVLSVVSIIVLMMILELFLSEGETKKYIKGIMSLIIILVIISPLPSLLKKDFSIESFFMENQNASKDIQTDKEFLYRIYISQYAEKELKIQEMLKEDGISEVIVDININYASDYSVVIESVVVNIENAVITINKENINIIDKINNTVISVINVSEDRIIIYGKVEE